MKIYPVVGVGVDHKSEIIEPHTVIRVMNWIFNGLYNSQEFAIMALNLLIANKCRISARP